MWISGANDTAKARDISIHDNVTNGKPVSNDVMHEQIASECIRENGGFANGCPGPVTTRTVCDRHGIKKTESIKKHIERLLFQHECRTRKLTPPPVIDVCAAAYSFVDREGFGEIVRAVCKYGESKGLAGVLRQCRQRRQCGEAVVRAVLDHAAGYTPTRKAAAGMTHVDKARLLCDGIVKHLESMVTNDSSVTPRDCDLIDDYLQNVCENGAAVVSLLRKKATGA